MGVINLDYRLAFSFRALRSIRVRDLPFDLRVRRVVIAQFPSSRCTLGKTSMQKELMRPAVRK